MSRSKVSVVFDGHEVLRFDGQTAQVQVIPIDARLQVAAALSRAAALFIEAQPAPLDSAVAADAEAILAEAKQTPAATVTH